MEESPADQLLLFTVAHRGMEFITWLQEKQTGTENREKKTEQERHGDRQTRTGKKKEKEKRK